MCRCSSERDQEFFDDMNSAQFAKIQKFFDTMPKLTPIQLR